MTLGELEEGADVLSVGESSQISVKVSKHGA